MKQILALAFFAITGKAVSQTVISPNTPISTVNLYPKGIYAYPNGTDTTYFMKDTSAFVTRYSYPVQYVHDTITVIKTVNNNRRVVSVTINKTGQWVATYSDNSTTVLTLKNSITIQ